ncbi:winged helix-turn-helix domain-containing protein [Candidatus Tisiphia endosymbiont of Parasteatoda lunata]
MSGYQYVYPPETICRMEFLLKLAPELIAFRKIQCIYLRAKFSYLPKQISEITGLSISRVRQIHTAYYQQGESVLKETKRGGRNHCYMDESNESKILKSFNHRASQGEVVVVREIQKKYEEVLQKKVTKSAIYKLLHRHHWRKVFPRPHHPNQNKDEMESFKKTSAQWLPPPMSGLSRRDLSYK